MFCFFQHDISDDVNAGEGVKLYRLLLDGSLGKEKETRTEKEKKDAVGSFAGKENSERPEKWNWDRFCTIEYAKINKHTHTE
jgi:hypothetical protein